MVQITSEGTPNRLPAPKMALKVSLVIGTDWRSVIQRATPARKPIVASVTRNDGKPHIGDEDAVDRADRRAGEQARR